MHDGDLTDNKSESGVVVRDRFPRGEAMDLFTFHFFEGSNKEIMVSQQKEEVLW